MADAKSIDTEQLTDSLDEALAILKAASHEFDYIEVQSPKARHDMHHDDIMRRAQSGGCLLSIVERRVSEVIEALTVHQELAS